MGFYTLTTRSYPVRLAWHADPAIDWWATADAMDIDAKPSEAAESARLEAKATAGVSALAVAESNQSEDKTIRREASKRARADIVALRAASQALANASSDRCLAAITQYTEGLDVALLVPKDGQTIQWFSVRALTEQERFDVRTEALSHCGNMGGNVRSTDGLRVLQGVTADRMHMLCYQACVTPPRGVGLTDDVRATLGEFALRLSVSSISQELADDVGKSFAPGS